ncbi:bifunctional phosphatase PAP2/diacylglycerol kinase family protein [Nocardia lijiangensis]|uniref:bifunctional phosphatase PAP2/diacylglycerol kinase family protein n=1 Tax=Nocardia lijiangensis TaxID=299618 RepID=UPI0009FC757C|nr:bifunctional phosphatase PAP2/diacylglycerol kinase family protein [Nocardia lijiangensis]
MRPPRIRKPAPPPALASNLDVWLIGRSAQVRPTAADRLLRSLSMSANHNRLWIGVGAGLMLCGNRPMRRAGARGLLACAVASGIANGIAKPVFPRRRPPDESVPFVRRLVRPPVSSSFPSGHAASAAAFATGVALESPAAAAAIAPVALAVGYSRVHIGVHWPSDVVAGGLLGSAIALATHRWWAVRADEPALLGRAEEVDPVRHGHGLLLVTNPLAGSGNGAPASAQLRAGLPAAQIVQIDPERDLGVQLDARLRGTDVTALGVSGGDGTVSSVAEVAVRCGVPLAVFADGTLNHFARDAGVDAAEQTLAALEHGTVVRVDAAEVRFDDDGARIFVNTASLGGYPDFVRLRERWQPRLGKWPAAGIAMIRVLLGAQPLHTVIDRVPTAIWMLFVGNGRYHPADQVPMARPELHRGTLDVRYLRADVRFSRTRLVWAALTGTLGSSATYVHREVPRLAVHVTENPVSLATDGEVDLRGSDFVFASRPSALALFRPPEE